MSPHDGAVDHRAFIVRILGKLSENPLQTPVSAHRLKRRWMFFQSPKRPGKSRQGMPAR
jgi:hypothetical protein